MRWLEATFAVPLQDIKGAGLQLLILAVTLGAVLILRRLTLERTDLLLERLDPRLRDTRLMRALRPLVVPAAWWLAVLVASGLLGGLGLATGLVRIAASLLLAWIAINAISALLREPLLSRALATIVWIIVALDILGLLGATEAALDSLAVTIGAFRLSLLGLIKAAALLAVLLWAAFSLSRLAERRIGGISGFSPSIRVLITNLLKMSLVVLAVIVALNTIGIDLTALAVFSGAIGVGIGFGLQKIVSNLVSGVILLLDESIKPGDVIEIEKTFGWITSLGARYVSVRSRDGKEYLIPNEDLITHRVTNWSYSNPQVRLDVPFGVAYGSDLHRVRELAIAAAMQPSRILKSPAPVCHVTEFAESTINFVLRAWIDDPSNGVTNVKGEIMLALYDSFAANGIELPFPQREIRVRSAAGAVAPSRPTAVLGD